MGTVTNAEMSEIKDKLESQRAAREAGLPAPVDDEIADKAEGSTVNRDMTAPKDGGPRKLPRPEPWFNPDGSLKEDYNKGAPDSPNEDIDIFQPEPRQLYGIPHEKDQKQGEPFTVYRAGWGAEKKIFMKISTLFTKIFEEKGLAALQNMSSDDLVAVIAEVPEIVEDVTAALTRQDKTWIEEHLDFQIMMEVIVPFFKRSFPKYQKTISRFQGVLGMLGIKVVETEVKTETKSPAPPLT